MNILYVLITLILIISSILIKKTDKKMNIIHTIAITIVLLLCYNIFICYIFDLTHIPITLFTLSIPNLLISILFIIKIIKDKQMQKYEINKRDIIYIVILLLIIGLIGYKNFGYPIQIKYFSTDAAMMHYDPSYKFYESTELVSVGDFKNVMPGLYINVGILFKITAPFIGEFNLYKVLILFDLGSLFLMGVLFYTLFSKIVKKYSTYLCILIFSILYTIGYPLNNLLCGFFYLGLGVIIINSILIILNNKQDILSNKTKMIILFLLNLGLFFTYYVFVPFVYGAQFIYYIIENKKKTKKLITKQLLVFILITLIIPCILGFQYNILQSIIYQRTSDTMAPTDIMKDEGYIYRNLFSNFILFVPFVIYYIYKAIKNKEIDFNIIILTLLILYILLILILRNCFNIISAYYMFKNYYVLWLIIMYLACFAMVKISEDIKHGENIILLFTLTYIVILTISLNFKTVDIIKTPFNENESILDVMDIYGMNKTLLLNLDKDYNNEEIEMLKYLYDNMQLNSENSILIANQRQLFWFNSILHYAPPENDIRDVFKVNDLIQWQQGEKHKYLIVFNRSEIKANNEKFLNIMVKDKKIIYSNDSGVVYINE